MYFENLADYHWPYYIRVCLSCYQLLFKQCQNSYCNNDFDLRGQNHSGYESQNKCYESNTLSSSSMFYTKKLMSLKRKEFSLRAAVLKPTSCCVCLIVLLNSRVYMGRTGYVFRPCLLKLVAYCKGTQTLLVQTYRLSWEVMLLFKLQKGSIFDPFCFRGFITVKTPELFSLHNFILQILHEAKREPL